MDKMLHKINFPSAKDFFLPELLENIYAKDRRNESINWNLSAKKCINPKFYKIKNFTWYSVLVFAHQIIDVPSVNYIHTDHPINLPMSTSKVGFNWILDGAGTMSFWDYSNVKEQPARKEDWLTHAIRKYDPLSPADQIHNMKQDSVYMVNAGVPHQVMSFNNRMCISVRCLNLDNYTWNDIVQLFSEEIIE